MKNLCCDTCGEMQNRTFPSDVKSMTCWKCTMLRAYKAEKAEESRLAESSPELIKKALKLKKWTQKALAAHLGESYFRVGQMCRGEITPSTGVHDWVTETLK